MSKNLNLKNEKEACLVLAWISDSTDLESQIKAQKSGYSNLISEILDTPAKTPRQKRRQNRLKQINEIEQLFKIMEKTEIKFLSRIDEKYPSSLNDLGLEKCWGIFYQGDLELLQNLAVGIVGTRKSTVYGNSIAGEIAFDLASSGVTVISGGASGIDTAAHFGALNANGKTICVQANGLDKKYPSKNELLFEKIQGRGLLVSEYPPGRTPLRHSFLARNRIIAALSKGVVVVEADLISGAISTANHANRLNRNVMAFPGNINSPKSAGCHNLVKSHQAELVTSAADILELISPIGINNQKSKEITSKFDTLEPEIKEFYGYLHLDNMKTYSELAKQSGFDELEVIKFLQTLQQNNFAYEIENSWGLVKGVETRGDLV